MVPEVKYMIMGSVARVSVRSRTGEAACTASSRKRKPSFGCRTMQGIVRVGQTFRASAT